MSGLLFRWGAHTSVQLFLRHRVPSFRTPPRSLHAAVFHRALTSKGMPTSVEETEDAYEELKAATGGQIPVASATGSPAADAAVADATNTSAFRQPPTDSAPGEGGSKPAAVLQPIQASVERAAHVVGEYVHDAELRVMQATYFKNRHRFRMTLLALGGCIVVGIVVFWPNIKSLFVSETSDVATQLLDAKDLQERASLFARTIVNETLSDDAIHRQADAFLSQLLSSPQTRLLVRELVSSTLQDESTRTEVKKLVDWVVDWLLHDESVRAQLTDLAVWLVAQDSVRAAVTELSMQTLADAQLQQKATDMSSSVVNATLDDPVVTAHAKTWLTGLFEDPSLRAQGGDYLYAAYKHSITPSFFRGGKHHEAHHEAAHAHAHKHAAHDTLSLPAGSSPAHLARSMSAPASSGATNELPAQQLTVVGLPALVPDVVLSPGLPMLPPALPSPLPSALEEADAEGTRGDTVAVVPSAGTLSLGTAAPQESGGSTGHVSPNAARDATESEEVVRVTPGSNNNTAIAAGVDLPGGASPVSTSPVAGVSPPAAAATAQPPAQAASNESAELPQRRGGEGESMHAGGAEHRVASVAPADAAVTAAPELRDGVTPVSDATTTHTSTRTADGEEGEDEGEAAVHDALGAKRYTDILERHNAEFPSRSWFSWSTHPSTHRANFSVSRDQLS